jgi:hypothetical protein
MLETTIVVFLVSARMNRPFGRFSVASYLSVPLPAIRLAWLLLPQSTV